MSLSEELEKKGENKVSKNGDYETGEKTKVLKV